MPGEHSAVSSAEPDLSFQAADFHRERLLSLVHGLANLGGLHDETGARLVGFDNAHAAPAKKRTRAARDEGSPAPAADDPALRVPGCGHPARGFLGRGRDGSKGKRSLGHDDAGALQYGLNFRAAYASAT
jgi:hypothetical protein